MSISKSFDFRFKSLTADKYAKLLESVDNPETVAAHFEAIPAVVDGNGKITTPASYKRKPVTVDMTLPDWVGSIPSVVGQDAIAELVASFIRFTYVDNFQFVAGMQYETAKDAKGNDIVRVVKNAQVGPHDWEAIEKWAQETGGRKRLEFTDDVLADAASSFGSYIGQMLNNPLIGDRLRETMAAKFSLASMQKHLNQVSEEVMAKVRTRLIAWAEWIAENDSEKSEEYAPVFAYLLGRLDKNREKLATIPEDIASVL